MIIYQEPNGTFKGVKVHDDGEFERTGLILLKCYRHPEQAKGIVDLGVLGKLGTTLKPCPAITRYGMDTEFEKNTQDLPKAEQDALIKQTEDVRYTNAGHRDAGLPMKYQTWRNVKDLWLSVMDKHDRRIDNLFTEYVYVYTHGHWDCLKSNEFGINPDLTLKQAFQDSGAVIHDIR